MKRPTVEQEAYIWASIDKALEILAEVYYKAAEVIDPAEMDIYIQGKAFPIRSRGRDIRIDALARNERMARAAEEMARVAGEVNQC